MTIERIHFTKQPLKKLLKIKYRQQKVEPKPNGFWYSAGDAWLEWCKSDMPQWVGEHACVLDLGASNILQLDTLEKIKAFSLEFGNKLYTQARAVFIDWPTVATRWDGIEIIPYQWSIRTDPDHFWYYGWDVASGCVWNLDKVSISSCKFVPSDLRDGVRACRDEVLDGSGGGKCGVADEARGLAPGQEPRANQ